MPSSAAVARSSWPSASGEWAPRIAGRLRCHDQTARQAIKAFNARGLAACAPSPAAPRPVQTSLTAERTEQLRAVLHENPHAFGKPTDVWTLPLAAAVAYERGITPTRLSGEAIRLALGRLGVRWQRAKRWSTNPDPAYTQRYHQPAVTSATG